MTVLSARMELHQQVQIELHRKGCILYSVSIHVITFINSQYICDRKMATCSSGNIELFTETAHAQPRET